MARVRFMRCAGKKYMLLVKGACMYVSKWGAVAKGLHAGNVCDVNMYV